MQPYRRPYHIEGDGPDRLRPCLQDGARRACYRESPARGRGRTDDRGRPREDHGGGAARADPRLVATRLPIEGMFNGTR
jgi:hypothetical protein